MSIPGKGGVLPLFVFPKAEQYLLFRVAGSGAVGGVYLAGTKENSWNIKRWRLDGKTMSLKRGGTLKMDVLDKDSQNLDVDLNQPI